MGWFAQLPHAVQQAPEWWQALWLLVTTSRSLIVLRLVGGLFGLGLVVRAFQRFRKREMRRVEFLLTIAFGVVIAAIAINPDLATALGQMLALQNKQYGRLIALLILSQMALWLLFMGQRAVSARQSRQFDLLVRRLAQQTFMSEEAHADIRSSITVIIPALNEAENLRALLPRMPQAVRGSPVAVIVVDDGSADDTVAVAHSAGAMVARNPINRGGGAALRLGFDLAIENRAAVIVTMDADGQHLPEELERLVAPILDHQLDFVIGSRVLGEWERDSRVRALGVHVFSFTINTLTGLRITDSSSGYRAFSGDAVKKLLLTQDQFHTAEAIIDGAKRGLRIGEVPITIRRRLLGESKKGKSVTYGANYSRSVVNTWLRD